jgi:uncharacterized protein (TIGR00251 family)
VRPVDRARRPLPRLSVRVRPGTRHSAVTSYDGVTVRIDIAAPATESRANEALVSFLASQLGVAKTRVALLHGHKARDKLVELDVDPSTVSSWLKTLPVRSDNT